MAHKTLINGTAYEIKGGKGKVNGTAYSIKSGKTKVGGTAYDISFGPPTFTLSCPIFKNSSGEYAPTFTFSFEEGMTWQQFMLSDYNKKYSAASAACEWVAMFVGWDGDFGCLLAYDGPSYGPGITIDSNGKLTSADLGGGTDNMLGPTTFETRSGTSVGLSDKIITGEAYQC